MIQLKQPKLLIYEYKGNKKDTRLARQVGIVWSGESENTARCYAETGSLHQGKQTIFRLHVFPILYRGKDV